MAYQFSPDHYHRQSIPLRGWDYTIPGGHFISSEIRRLGDI